MKQIKLAASKPTAPFISLKTGTNTSAKGLLDAQLYTVIAEFSIDLNNQLISGGTDYAKSFVSFFVGKLASNQHVLCVKTHRAKSARAPILKLLEVATEGELLALLCKCYDFKKIASLRNQYVAGDF